MALIDDRDTEPLAASIYEVFLLGMGQDDVEADEREYATARADALEAFAAELAGRVMELEALATWLDTERSYDMPIDVRWAVDEALRGPA